MAREIKITERRESIFEFWKEHTNADFTIFSPLFAQQPLFNGSVEQLLKGSAFVIFNHAVGTWEYVNDEMEKLTGYSSEMHQKEGFKYTFKYTHPEYVDFIFQGSHRIIFDYLYSISIDKRKQVSFSKDFLYLIHEKEYVRVLQKGIVLDINEDGGIVRTLHVISLINHLKRDNDANLIIKSPENIFTIYNYDSQEKTISNLGGLSKRESEILELLAKGCSTKKIAQQLFLSEHTVSTHRRNLLNKTNCIDTTALVTYAKMVGMI
jgi:DNA-binding CsgD family transcriptional regulator